MGLTKCLSPGKPQISLFEESRGSALTSCKNQNGHSHAWFHFVEQNCGYATAQTDPFVPCCSGGLRVNRALAASSCHGAGLNGFLCLRVGTDAAAEENPSGTKHLSVSVAGWLLRRVREPFPSLMNLVRAMCAHTVPEFHCSAARVADNVCT